MSKGLTNRNTSLLFLVFFLFCSFVLQGDKVLWGPKVPVGIIYMLGESDGVLYSLRVKMRKIYLEKTNSKTLASISSEEISTGKGGDGIYPGFGFIHDGQIFLIGGKLEKGMTEYHGKVLDKDFKTIRPWTLLISGEQDVIMSGEILKVSPDRKSFVLGMCHSDPKSKEHTYSLSVVDMDFNKKWEKAFTLTNDENQMHIEDLQIDNAGRVYLLAGYAASMGEYINQVLQEQQVTGKIVYAAYDGVSEDIFTKDLTIESGSVYSAKLQLDSDGGNMILCGLYTRSEDKVEGLSGVFYSRFKLGAKPEEIVLTDVNKEFVTELVQMESYSLLRMKKKDYSSFKIIKLVPNSDGGFICVGECLLYNFGTTSAPGDQRMQSGFTYESNSLFAIKFGSSNGIEKTTILPYKCESTIRHTNNGNSFLVIPQPTHLDILYADHPKNTVDGVRKEFRDLKEPQLKKRIIVRSKMTFDGEFEHIMLDPGETENLSPYFYRSIVSDSGQLYISGSAMKGVSVNSYIGKINLKE